MYHNGSVFNHTGLVIAVSGNSYTTIEGNTNDGSGVVAEGIGVYQRNRTLSASSGTRFARPDYSIINSINNSGETTTPSTWTTKSTGVCTGDGVYVRQTPGGAIMGTVSKGTSLELEWNQLWCMGSCESVWNRNRLYASGLCRQRNCFHRFLRSKTAQTALNSKFKAGIDCRRYLGICESESIY